MLTNNTLFDHWRRAATTGIAGSLLLPGLAAAQMSSEEASRQLLAARSATASFVEPVSNFSHYGFAYAEKWNPAGATATLHPGADINTSNDCGRRVVAVGDGIVRYTGRADTSNWYGVVLIQHRYWDGTQQRYAEVASLYGHVAPLDTLRQGDLVTAGQHIGYIADQNTGTCTAFAGVADYGHYDVRWGPHLHFELRTTVSLAHNHWPSTAQYQRASACANILDASFSCRTAAADALGYRSPRQWVQDHADVRPDLPRPPVGLTVTETAGRVPVLRWTDNSANELGFKVERRQGASGSWARVATVAAGQTSYTGNPLTAGQEVRFRVLATNPRGDSAPSNEVVLTAGAGVTRPAAPTALTAGTATSTSVRVSWADASQNETGFRVELSGGGGSWRTAASTVANGTSALLSGLLPATAYSVRVMAVNAAGDSAASSVVAFRTAAATPTTPNTPPNPVQPVTAPTVPQLLSAVALSRSAVRLGWADRSTNETGFRLERRLGLGAWTLLASLPANSTGHTDTSVLGGRSYSYRVSAVNAAGSSTASNVLAVSTPR